MCCFQVLIYFWRTRAILILDQGSIYAGGVCNFWLLNIMYFSSLGSVLICGWNVFGVCLSSFFFICSLYRFDFYCSYLELHKRVGHVYILGLFAGTSNRWVTRKPEKPLKESGIQSPVKRIIHLRESGIYFQMDPTTSGQYD